LEDQLTRSLDRLGLETLDVCLLHNPEYFLTDAVKRGEGPIEKLRAELYRRFELAFAHFEKEVERKRIRFYGVSSNTCVAPADDRESTDLSRMLDAARGAAGDRHHFRVLQLPFNLLEGGAALQKNQEQTVLERALHANIGVLVNRPLNAIVGQGLVRLADPPLLAGAPPLDAALESVKELESEFRDRIAPNLRTSPGTPPAAALFNWGEQLARLPAAATTLAQWNDLESQVVLPRANSVLRAVDGAMRGDMAPIWKQWRERYASALDGLLTAIGQRAAATTRKTSEQIHRVIEPLVPPARRNEPLSRLALWSLSSTPGVTSVLLGMRRREWVEDALPLLAWKPLAEPIGVFEALRDAKVE
jgi:aryl-alcohol dehydrogenase-like predicted oxidoreductase